MPSQSRKTCSMPPCNRPQWSLGFCGQCVKRLRAERPEEAARLEAMSLEQRAHQNYLTKHALPLPPWTFEGDEDYLARRQHYLDTHDVPMLLTWDELDALIRQEAQETTNG